jgi:DNA-binding transcriptional LysR family regulator
MFRPGKGPHLLRRGNEVLAGIVSTEDLRFFVAVAGSASLSAAARSLDVTPPAVTQRLRLMEEKLGVRLVSRTRGGLLLTDEGQTMVERGRRILDELSELSDAIAARRGTISGNLSIVAPFGFGRRYIAPLAARFRIAYPEVRISLMLSDQPGQGRDNLCDLVIHIGKLRDSTLRARRIAPNERFICAAPSYLVSCGTPASPEDLRRHHCLVLRENAEDVTKLAFLPAERRNPVHVRIETALASNDGDVIRTWALAGTGLMVRSEWDVADDLKAGRLVRVLERWRMPSADICALFDGRHGTTARADQFLDWLRKSLTPVPWRNLAR